MDDDKNLPPEISSEEKLVEAYASQLRDYKKELNTLEQKSQESYDKHVIYLSGGALGISFALTQNFFGNKGTLEPNLLFWSWILWGLSLLLILISFYSSVLNLRHAMRIVDNAVDSMKTIDDCNKESRNLGAPIRVIFMHFLNIGAGISFLVGVFLFALFVNKNLLKIDSGGQNAQYKSITNTQPITKGTK
jgi:hypothetical protein